MLSAIGGLSINAVMLVLIIFEPLLPSRKMSVLLNPPPSYQGSCPPEAENPRKVRCLFDFWTFWIGSWCL